jgi:hypothetical protein
MRSSIHLAALAVLTLVLLMAWPPLVQAQSRGIAVNGVPLDDGTVATLERAYRTRLAPGRYWYDPRSGLWGYELGPSQGQIAPGLRLGGPLNPRASVGYRAGVTRVYINGREIHPQELGYLQRLYGHVQPARYWLDARGIGGYEGGPAQFDLRAQAMSQQRSAGYTRRGPGGNTGSDGQCSYYNDPSSGASVMTGNC